MSFEFTSGPEAACIDHVDARIKEIADVTIEIARPAEVAR
jgi:hypothetical protein